MLVIACGLSAGFFVSMFGFDIQYLIVRTMFVAFLLALGSMIVCTVLLFFIMKKNRVLKNDFLIFAFVAPIYLLLLIAAIAALFTVKTTVMADGVVRITSKSFYPLFVMLPLGLENGVFCYYAYIKVLVVEQTRRTKAANKDDE